MSVRKTKKPADATDVLAAQHVVIRELFANYRTLAGTTGVSADQRRTNAADLCALLSIHQRVEDELFYPVARDALWDVALLDEAVADHAIVVELIDALASMPPHEAPFGATMTILEEYVVLHFKEEEGRIFPALRAAKVNLVELGALLQARHETLVERQAGVMDTPRERAGTITASPGIRA